MERDLLELLGVVPLLPLAGAAFLLLFGRRIGEPVAGWIATGLMVAAFLWSLVMLIAMVSLPEDARSVTSVAFTWLPVDQLQVEFGFLADPLSITWCLLVTGVGSLIFLYSIGYMRGDPNFGRFFTYLSLFAGSMLLLVTGSSYLLTFLGWEGVGLCSYLLIAFWFERSSAAVAGKKAFVTNRVGDVGFLLAMFILIAEFGTLDYGATGAAAPSAANDTVTAVALLLLLAAVGKSAQIPLFPWLTDAMEGPTPVSALIHAATMVTAGVYLIARAHPFFEASGDALTVVAWVGVLTALLAGGAALVQPDIKRVLAYSTISQLGYMFLALGVQAYTAAVFMVLMHTFFKGCLFLGAGSVIHGNEENQDIRIMGRFRRFLPFTAIGMTIAWLAIAGVPPLAGFWAKDEILQSAFLAGDYAVWALGLIAAVFTAMYMTRLIQLVVLRQRAVPRRRGCADHGPGGVAAAPTTTAPTVSPAVDVIDPADTPEATRLRPRLPPDGLLHRSHAARVAPARPRPARVTDDHARPDPRARDAVDLRWAHQPAARRTRLPRPVPRAGVRGRAPAAPRLLRRRVHARGHRGGVRARRARDRAPALPARPAQRRRGPDRRAHRKARPGARPRVLRRRRLRPRSSTVPDAPPPSSSTRTSTRR